MTPKGIPQKLGPKLKAIRLHLGYTLEQMAEAVGKTGSSRRTASMSGRRASANRTYAACWPTHGSPASRPMF